MFNKENMSNDCFDSIEKRIKAFLINGQDDYNDIVESIRSLSFIGKISEKEAEKLLLMLPNLSEDEDNTLCGLNDESQISSYCDNYDDEEETNYSFLEDEVKKEETINPFELSLDNEFLDSEPTNYNNDDMFEDDEIEDTRSSFDLNDEEEDLLSYNNDDMFENDEEDENSSGFDVDLNDDCEFYNNRDFDFDESDPNDYKSDPFSFLDDEDY